MVTNSITGKSDITLNAPTPAKKDKPAQSAATNSEQTTEKVDFMAITQEIKSTLDSTPVINEEKIAAVKNALEQGSYEINAERIADKILQLDRHIKST